MSYFNVYFAFLFIPLLIIIYNLIPKKVRPFLLLLASFGFFFVVSRWRIIFLGASILSIYLIGIWMDKIDKKKELLLESADSDSKKEIKNKCKKDKKRVLLLGILFNISFLFIIPL